MVTIQYVSEGDRAFWFTLDKHLPESEFSKKVRDQMGYVLFEDERPAGILRYNLFWDIVPFCNMLFVDWACQRRGYGGMLMERWERDMKARGHAMLMTSTQVDETAQHFYRKLGYQDAGGIVMSVPPFEQPMEMFFVKGI